MHQRVLLLLAVLVVSAFAQSNVIKYISEFANKNPNVDERYRAAIRHTEESHRTNYETQVSKRVNNLHTKQLAVEKEIAIAKSATQELRLKRRLLRGRIRAMMKHSEVAISREKLGALRNKYDRVTRRLRRSLMTEAALDHKYRDQRKITASIEREEDARRKRQFEDYKEQLKVEAEEERQRLIQDKADKEKEVEALHKRIAEESAKKEAAEQAMKEAAEAAARAEAKKRQEELDKEAKRRSEMLREATWEHEKIHTDALKDMAKVEHEYEIEELRLRRLLREANMYQEKAKSDALQESEHQQAQEEADRTMTESRIAKEMVEKAKAQEAVMEAQSAKAGGATLLELTGGARARCQISVSSTGSSSSGDEPTVDGLNSKGECQIGPKVQPTIEELYPILPELHKRPQEEFHENDYMDTRKVQLPEMDGKLSVDLQVFSSSEKLLQHAHNEHLTFTEQNKKTCGKPICEPKVDHFAGYP